MSRVYLVHWKEPELPERVRRLESAGHEVVAWHEANGPALLRRLAEDVPDAVVIDLGRLPSHGREVGVALRSRKTTRSVPLVFVEGAPEKVGRVKGVLPDAVFTTWGRVRTALRRAIERPPTDPVRPESGMASYAKVPLARKLGIRPRSVVGLVGAPADFERTLAPLPEGVAIRRGARGRCDVTLWFVPSHAELRRRLRGMLRHGDGGGLWICWPKKASGVRTDLTQPVVRKTVMDAGLVDYKICSVDETWSGLRFSRRDAGA